MILNRHQPPTARLQRGPHVLSLLILIVAATFVGAPRASAQTIIGVLLNEDTGAPVGRAYVVLLDTDDREAEFSRLVKFQQNPFGFKNPSRDELNALFVDLLEVGE